ncbi:hypothetical protein BCR37DRAFT_392479 [Protomyces lactucae-debilis]|uniref:Uncharacterized protein n=1 Tax=Protomyces lactucae-debilis TaxID=2754530 RepID=A0A1Y2FGR3_PROLT|nr:uncharacterized protein BCR37DRAFT_392479 [Protomyces lactucae-debilis]ORY83130.1 hypothetical protein BCR37DRAFT_392479 [Protomyces lactucae-debilis]
MNNEGEGRAAPLSTTHVVVQAGGQLYLNCHFYDRRPPDETTIVPAETRPEETVDHLERTVESLAPAVPDSQRATAARTLGHAVEYEITDRMPFATRVAQSAHPPVQSASPAPPSKSRHRRRNRDKLAVEPAQGKDTTMLDLETAVATLSIPCTASAQVIQPSLSAAEEDAPVREKPVRRVRVKPEPEEATLLHAPQARRSVRQQIKQEPGNPLIL